MVLAWYALEKKVLESEAKDKERKGEMRELLAPKF